MTEDYVMKPEQVDKKVTAMPNITTFIKGYKDKDGKEWVIVETTISKWYSKKLFDKMEYREKKE